MKELAELSIPDDRRYAADHEWARAEGGLVRVGISDYAQDRLGDVVYVELPAVGAAFGRGEVFGSVESVKAVSDLVLPVGGKVVERNDALADAPQRVNDSPYGEGWLVAVRPADPGELDGLMTADAYRAFLEKAG
ncbi:MAG: glycine cleavage system protein GcvH [Deferrisomatales bacterium]